jgi:hypothetical protein
VTADVVKLPPRDPIFALAPELRLHQSKLDGRIVVNSREVARVFGRRHRRLLRHIMKKIWHMKMRSPHESWFCFRADGTVDMTSDGLSFVVCGPRWGKRANQFNVDWIKLVCGTMREIEAKTGINPAIEKFKQLGLHPHYFTANGRQCCDECRQPLPQGPVLHDELWATIAQPDLEHAFLCFDCTEKRLGRGLTQADLKTCPFNAGWISFDGADVAALQFARGRQLLPLGEVSP